MPLKHAGINQARDGDGGLRWKTDQRDQGIVFEAFVKEVGVRVQEGEQSEGFKGGEHRLEIRLVQEPSGHGGGEGGPFESMRFDRPPELAGNPWRVRQAGDRQSAEKAAALLDELRGVFIEPPRLLDAPGKPLIRKDRYGGRDQLEADAPFFEALEPSFQVEKKGRQRAGDRVGESAVRPFFQVQAEPGAVRHLRGELLADRVGVNIDDHGVGCLVRWRAW